MKMNGARILVEELIHQGVEVIFGYPGGAVLNIYDELYLASDRIRHVLSAHEQGAAHAADGYARASGKTGVVLATSGPGATNLVTGIANAYLDSVPMVAITGNVAVSSLGKDSFQEVDIVGITQPIVKHNFMVRDIKDLQRTIQEAFEIANDGRKGPVLIDIPKNVQAAEWEYDPDMKAPSVKKARKTSISSLDELLEMVKKAKRPFIYAGGGVIASGAEKRGPGAFKAVRCGRGTQHDGPHLSAGLLSAEPGHVRHARTVRLHHGPVPVRSAVCCGRAVFEPGHRRPE